MPALRNNLTPPLTKPLWNPPLSLRISSETYIASEIREGTAISVIDGSYKEDWGVVALIIEGSDHATHKITATCTSTGQLKYQDSYISEPTGIFHVVSIAEEIVWKFNIIEGAITIVCDGLNAIKKAMGSETR